MKRCPACKSKSRLRIPRAFLLKVLPKNRIYICYNCSTKYLWVAFIGRSLTLKKGHYKPKENIKGELLRLAMENKS